MTEHTRNEIIHRWRQGASQRSIAQALGLSRGVVARVVARHRATRADDVKLAGEPADQSAAPQPTVAPAPRAPRPRPSQLDAFADQIQQWLARYPDITTTRLFEELRAAGYPGGYTILRERVNRLRGSRQPLVQRFETLPGQQAQMDWGVYWLDFSDEGRRRVNCFSYVLGYSRRQYLRFTESQDQTTLQREHVRAFEHLGGVAATCLYDNQKAVVTRWEDEQPLYNTTFLAFATHYGFRPIACRPRRPQTKGKVERPFQYIETNLLNGRTFRGLEHLNEVAAAWLANTADVRVHGETHKRPCDAHAEERPHLLPLPARPYDTALVVYRVVDAEGCIGYDRHSYSAPWQLVGQLLPVRVEERELVVYDEQFREVARHGLFPRDPKGQRRIDPAHRPSERVPREDLRPRFVALGEIAARFYDGLLRQQSYAQHHARQTLGLLGLYRPRDLLAAMERALRYGAFTWQALERILAVTAKPRPASEIVPADYTPPLCDDPIPPRPTSAYQHLLNDEASPAPGAKPGGAPPSSEIPRTASPSAHPEVLHEPPPLPDEIRPAHPDACADSGSTS